MKKRYVFWLLFVLLSFNSFAANLTVRNGGVQVYNSDQSFGSIIIEDGGKVTFNGNVTAASVTIKLGGIMIVNGNLDVVTNGGAKLVVDGTLIIAGNLNIQSNGNSEANTIESDGILVVGGSYDFGGSKQTSSGAVYLSNPADGTGIGGSGVNGGIEDLIEADILPNDILVDFIEESGYVSNLPIRKWKGTVDSNWFNADNWSGGVPTSTTDITIKAVVLPNVYPVINNTAIAQVRNLTIEADATLILNPGTRLTVSGNLITNGKLVVKNTAEEPVSIITQGTVTGTENANIQWTLKERSWWYIGHSVTGVTEGDYVTSFSGEGNFAINQYSGGKWNRIAGVGETYSAGVYPFNVPLEGYSITLKNSGETLSYNGVLNNDASYTSDDFNAGWCLIANPYPSYIDLSSEGFNMGDFNKTVYIRRNDNQVSTYNTKSDVGLKGGSKYVSPGQCVWLRTYSDFDKVTISNTVRTHAPAGNMLKSGSVEPNDRLRLMLESEYGSDELVVIFNQNGSKTYTAYDSEKLMNGGNMANLYSLKVDKEVAINSLPELSSGTVVPVAYKVAEKGICEMTIKASNLSNFMPEAVVYLEDKVAGVTVNLRETPSYTFTPVEVSATDRFELRFELNVEPNVESSVEPNSGSGSESIDEPDPESNEESSVEGVSTDVKDVIVDATSYKVLIFGVKQSAQVKVDQHLLQAKNKKITVYNVSGQLMATHELMNTVTKFDLPQRNVAFIIRVNLDGIVHKAVVIGMD